MSHHPQHIHHHEHDDPHATMDTPGATHDPVCNHWVVPERAHGSTTLRGTTVFFCSSACKRAFDKTPDKFLARLKTQ